METEDTVSSASLRAAHFKAVAAIWRDGEILIGEGICPGHIALEPMEGSGFGFDPIFIPYDLDKELQPLSAGNYGEHSTHGKTFGGVDLAPRTNSVIELEHYKTCSTNCHQHDKSEVTG